MADPQRSSEGRPGARGLRVLCGIDESEGSMIAFRFALEKLVIPERGDTLVLFKAARPLNPEMTAYMTKQQGDFVQELEELNRYDELRKLQEEAAAKVLEALLSSRGMEKLDRHDEFWKLQRDAASKVPSELVVTMGDPREKIFEYVLKHQIDLVVVGSRGLGTLKGVILGSVSSFLIYYSPVPVAVVPVPKE